MYHNKGLIDVLTTEENDCNVRGSDNHKQAIASHMKYFTEEVVIIDCDMFLLHRGIVQDMARKLLKQPIYGIRHKGRGYVWPSLCAVRTAYLKQHSIIGSYEDDGDTLEILSKDKEFPEYIYEHSAITNRENDNGLGALYVTEGKVIARHYGSASRYTPNGVDSFTSNELTTVQKWFEIMYPKTMMVIPSYGEYHDSILDVCQSWNDWVCAVGNRNHVKETERHVSLFRGIYSKSKSKAKLMNIAFLNHYADNYLFQDRDIPVTSEWLKKFNTHLGNEDVMVCQNGVWYGDILEPIPPGGSVLVERDTFLRVGGFDHYMEGVGLEDREFLLRCGKVLKKEIPKMDIHLHHIEHERRLTYPEYKTRIRKKVIDGTLNMIGRTNYIWDMMKNGIFN